VRGIVSANWWVLTGYVVLVAFCAAINHFEGFVLGLIVLRATKNGENDI
jgi:hypothetical protein